MKNIKEYQQKNLLQLIENLRNIPAHKQKLTNVNTHEDFIKLPLASYKDIEQDINLERSKFKGHFCSGLIRFQPTSGSSNKLKWIPYNQLLLDQFDKAASIWMADIANQHPQIKKGSHYWSLSWLPNDLRKIQYLDDSEILSPLRRFILQNIFAVPKEVMFTETIEDNLFATTCFLVAAQDLTFISVWSPTFLMSLLEVIENEKNKIIKVLETGLWPKDFKIAVSAPQNFKQAQKLKFNVAPAKYWDELRLISCWDTAQSESYARKLKTIFPNTKFQGKGLWATEGVITLPIGEDYLLSYQSHFYEFQDITDKKIYPCWELKQGMIVNPIITTPNGFIRYKINDRLLVKGHKRSNPILEFLGRIGDCDLVGEKISHQFVDDLFNKIKGSTYPLSLIGIEAPSKGGLPYYLLLGEGDSDISKQIEDHLLENYHYKLARELKQLDSAIFFSCHEPYKLYEQLCLNKGMIKGNIKIDHLISIKTDEFRYG